MSADGGRAGERIVAVTVTYGDRLALLKRQALAVLADPHVTRWIIVANGSDAQHIAAVIEGERAEVIALHSNAGSAPAFAAGIAAALALGADCVWLLDDDNLPEPGALAALLAARARLSAANVDTSRVALCAWRESVHAHAGLRRRASSFLGFHIFDLPRRCFGLRSRRDQGTLLAQQSAPYGGLLLPRQLLAGAGPPDPRFVLYADDTEFSDRLIRQGGQIFLVPEARIADLVPRWQKSGRMLGSWLGERDEARVYYGARNEAWFDRHRLMGNRVVYRVNRAAYLLALWLLSRRDERRARFALLVDAVRAGERGALGVDARFPLSALDGKSAR